MNGPRRLVPTTAAIALAAITAAPAAPPLQNAAVTRVYNQVELLAPERGPVPAKIGDDVSGRTAVQTGNQSRAELQFNDQTLARLGANSLFSFDRGTRDLNLDEGVILLEVPKDAGGATINTAAVTAAVTGTTVMLETRKGKKPGQGLVKFIVLEGTMRLKLNGRLGESVLLSAGQMITLSGSPRALPAPVYVDVARLTDTSGLMGKQFGPLKNEPFIRDTITQQRLLKTQGKLINLNYGLYGKKKTVVLQVISAASQATLRTDAERPRSQPAPARPPANVPPRPSVNRPPAPAPKPPKPPVVRPPEPPPQPPAPDRPRPPAPPPVPPAPPVVPQPSPPPT